MKIATVVVVDPSCKGGYVVASIAGKARRDIDTHRAAL